jgi:hypothetical protein
MEKGIFPWNTRDDFWEGSEEMVVVPQNDCVGGEVDEYLGGHPNCRVQNETMRPYPFLDNLGRAKKGCEWRKTEGHGLTYVERILERQWMGIPYYVGDGDFDIVKGNCGIDWMDLYRQSYLRLNNLSYLYGVMLKEAIAKGMDTNKRKCSSGDDEEETMRLGASGFFFPSVDGRNGKRKGEEKEE